MDKLLQNFLYVAARTQQKEETAKLSKALGKIKPENIKTQVAPPPTVYEYPGF